MAEEGLDEKFFLETLNENRESIKRHVHQTIMDGLTERFKWNLPQAVNEAIDLFLKEEIVPEIRTQLMADKDQIVSAATAVAKMVAVEVGQAIQKKVAENLASSWNVKKLMEGLVG
jgi:hypothetical protein